MLSSGGRTGTHEEEANTQNHFKSRRSEEREGWEGKPGVRFKNDERVRSGVRENNHTSVNYQRAVILLYHFISVHSTHNPCVDTPPILQE